MYSTNKYTLYDVILITRQMVVVEALFLTCISVTSSLFHPLASHYSSMLEREGVTELLQALVAHPNTHNDVTGLSNSILQMVEQNQSHLGVESQNS